MRRARYRSALPESMPAGQVALGVSTDVAMSLQASPPKVSRRTKVAPLVKQITATCCCLVVAASSWTSVGAQRLQPAPKPAPKPTLATASGAPVPDSSVDMIAYLHPAAAAAGPSVYHSIIDKTASGLQPASPIQTSSATLGDLSTAAGHHHGHHHGKYYEYREVPKKGTWKFGYKRGNHKHHIERHEHGKASKHHSHFKTKVKWADKKSKGKGIHLWDYNHTKKHHHYG